MKQCDLCGKRAEIREVIIEGSLMSVCNVCSAYGVEVKKPVFVPVLEPIIEVVEETVVGDFGNTIRKGREKKGLKQAELAKAIGEKESVVQAVENGKIKPNLKIAKKLEVFLSIKLVSQEIKEKRDFNSLDFNDPKLTVGDFMRKD